jgi:hypothetical protein
MAKTKVGLLSWLNGPLDEFEEVGEHMKDVEVGANPLGKLNPRNLVLVLNAVEGTRCTFLNPSSRCTSFFCCLTFVLN